MGDTPKPPGGWTGGHTSGYSERITPPMAKLLRESLQKRLDEAVPPAIVARILSVLAAVDAKGSKALLIKLVEPDVAPQIRAAAFRGLRGVELTTLQTKAMMTSLEDNAQKPVHEAIREVLISLPELPSGIAPGLKRLLASRQQEQRLFALRMLRTAGGAELAKSFLKLLVKSTIISYNSSKLKSLRW